jgi:Dynamin family
MDSSFARELDSLADWRQAVDRKAGDLKRVLAAHELLDTSANDLIDSMRQRLSVERLVVTFVAEFSRGKSELINAIFFADTGRRILPATPGRTTMCPVELGYQSGEPPVLSLLPIETRLQGLTLDELRRHPEAWTSLRLDPKSPARLSEAMTELQRTKAVTLPEAKALGFWDEERPDGNPPLVAEGLVEVPAWRHAVLNYPHPLLRRGLVVLDTPGLNAIGAEPELTLNLLPSAHAVVFVLAADAGVTRTDLTIWRDYLSAQTMARFVVLNKIDALADPLLDDEAIESQIEYQHQSTAATLGLPAERVFPLSARQALTGRIEQLPSMLATSRLPSFEAALSQQLLPRRRELLEQVVLEGALVLEAQVTRHLGTLRQQAAARMTELQDLRGQSGSRVKLLLERVLTESAEFEQSTKRLSALATVQARMVRDMLGGLAAERQAQAVEQLHKEIGKKLIKIGAKKIFAALCERLREQLKTAASRCAEIEQMLGASFTQLEAEYGFTFKMESAPTLRQAMADLDLLERNYSQYLGLGNALRLADPKFLDQFRRMLLSKLNVLFESASTELELWNRAASVQLDAQLRDRRRGFKRRREALERVRASTGELEQRIAELAAQDQVLQESLQSVLAQINKLRAYARRMPGPARPAADAPASSETEAGSEAGETVPASEPAREPPALKLVVPRVRARTG